MKSIRDILALRGKSVQHINDRIGTPVIVYQGEHSKESPAPPKKPKPSKTIKEFVSHPSTIKEAYYGEKNDDLPITQAVHLSGNPINGHIVPLPTKLKPTEDDWDTHRRHMELLDTYLTKSHAVHIRPEWDHLRRYSNSSYDLNTKLYEAHRNGAQEHDLLDRIGETHHTQMKNIDKIIGARRLDKHITTFSGIRFDPSKTVNKDGRIFLPSYTSTSLDAALAKDFAHHMDRHGELLDKSLLGKAGFLDYMENNPVHHAHILQIGNRVGTHGAYIGQNSTYDHEKELLLPRNTVMHIHPEPVVHTLYDPLLSRGNNKYQTKYHIWKATPLLPEEV